MEAQLGLAMASMLAGAWRWEGISAYPGPMTQEIDAEECVVGVESLAREGERRVGRRRLNHAG